LKNASEKRPNTVTLNVHRIDGAGGLGAGSGHLAHRYAFPTRFSIIALLSIAISSCAPTARESGHRAESAAARDGSRAALPVSKELGHRAELACKQIHGTFSAPNFCRLEDSVWYKVGGVPLLPNGWMCANPPYDQDPTYGSCTNPQTKAFDWNYCVKSGIPKDGCALVLRPTGR
jgi:hypothetical protein